MKVEHKEFNNDRFFGVELEAAPTLELNDVATVIRHCSLREVRVSGWTQTSSNDYWHVKTDRTCGTSDRLGVEVASFKASGPADILHISRMAAILETCGLQVNERCGLHIHVDLSDFEPSDAGVLMARWAKVEGVMCNAVPRHRFRSIHCKPLTKFTNFRYNRDPLLFWQLHRPRHLGVHHNPFKRVMCNFVNYASSIRFEGSLRHYGVDVPSKKTVEFRFPEGTLNELEIANWVRLFLLFVEESKKNKMPTNIDSITELDEFLSYFGLFQKDAFYILDTSLHGLKKWFLRRLLKHGKKRFRMAATRKLQQMLGPEFTVQT